MKRTQTLRPRSTADGLSPRAVGYFFVGPDQNNRPFADEAAARPVWHAHEATLVRWWVEGFPPEFDWWSVRFLLLLDEGPKWGRPWAWWRFSSPEPRRLVSVFEDRGRDPTDEDRERARALGMGRSPNDHEYAGGIGYTFESDKEYFARLGIDPEKP